jgi:aminoglycoside 6'-N-acetyltransferase
MLADWLREPLVRRWWNHETSAAAVVRDFGPSVDGEDPAEYFVALDGAEPYGLMKRYPFGPYPEYIGELAPVRPVDPRALSIDYLIGDPHRRGRGFATAMISVLVSDAWDAYPDAPEVVVPVAAGNRASWRALERAGFSRVASGPLEPDNPIDPPEHLIYWLPRPGEIGGARHRSDGDDRQRAGC